MDNKLNLMKPNFALFTILIFQLAFMNLKAQSNYTDKYYKDGEYSLLSIVKAIDKTGFELQNLEISLQDFKKIVLQLEDADIRQLNISSRYLCTEKHNDNFEIWNMFYKKITKSFYDENCEQLIALMILDGTIKQPR